MDVPSKLCFNRCVDIRLFLSKLQARCRKMFCFFWRPRPVPVRTRIILLALRPVFKLLACFYRVIDKPPISAFVFSRASRRQHRNLVVRHAILFWAFSLLSSLLVCTEIITERILRPVYLACSACVLKVAHCGTARAVFATISALKLRMRYSWWRVKMLSCLMYTVAR